MLSPNLQRFNEIVDYRVELWQRQYGSQQSGEIARRAALTLHAVPFYYDSVSREWQSRSDRIIIKWADQHEVLFIFHEGS